jgi:5-methylcytosine-specific restriction endonuclease McrA
MAETKGKAQASKKPLRADHIGPKRTTYAKAKKRIFATQTVCALCGKPVDFSLKWPDPMSATVDHIVPLAKGGEVDDINNMQLAHLCCNRVKGDSLPKMHRKKEIVISNRILPQHFDWTTFGK